MTGLQRRTPLKRTGGLKRTPMKRKRSVSKADFTDAVRAEVRRRSGGRCEARISGVCTGKAEHMHHKRLRKSGDGTADNALYVCLPCHGWIHANVAVSYERGLLVRSN